jgi:hypothetical protein
MSVYVDDMRANYGRMVMCHMLADTHDELLAMADKIGMQLRCIQHAGTPKEHFDVSLTKRALAVHYGALEITWKEAGKIVATRRTRFSPRGGFTHAGAPTREELPA